MKKILFLFVFIIQSAQAAFLIQGTSSFTSSTDSKTSTSLSDISNHFFVGASIGSNQQTFIGQNITSFSGQVKKTNTDKINTLELGPKVIYFFSEDHVFYTSLGWNPYAKGKRSVSGVNSEISGWAYLASIGAELKINRNFHIGASFNYHSLKLTKSISDNNVASTTNDTSTSIMPMINFSFHFR